MFHTAVVCFSLSLTSLVFQSSEVWAADLADVYNQGVQHYKQSQFDDAAASFKQAAASSDDRLAARARYNLGNSLYAKATEIIRKSGDDQVRLGDGGGSQPEQDSSPIPLLEDAVAAYRSSLRLNPDDEDARFNLENATRLIDQLKDQKSDQKSSDQKQDDSQQDQKNDPSKDQQQQQQQDSADQDPKENEPQDQSQDGDDQPNESGKEESDEEESGEESEEDSGDPEKPDEQENDDKGDQQSEQDASQQPGENEQASNQQQQQQGNAQPGADAAGSQPAAKEMTEQEAKKMLQAIRDRDMQRRNLLEALKRSRRVVVPRDW
ncbi:hypothetical protein LF1_51250 [Rubripirellula obstinata]|uniref:Tetratricopeptide repeat protein n=1 Tax=Rubripirellula obstinata TaxID=406547 RepID=A0A5B1CRQ5_9BACT|nr:hypothetical protein [Rubripirellula obstinata]KAA1262559.1 hypothetical protein LF1_51250 [Rubripirellula obstinata]